MTRSLLDTQEHWLPFLLALSVKSLVALASTSRSSQRAVASSLTSLVTMSRRGSEPCVDPPSLRHFALYRRVTSHYRSHTQVAAGLRHAVAVDAKGSPHFFGSLLVDDGLNQQLAAGSAPLCLALRRPTVAVACGWNHTLLLDAFGSVFSFGLGSDGQLGHGDTASRAAPHLVKSLCHSCAVQVAAGSAHSLVLALPLHTMTPGNIVYAFGLNEEGQLGLGDRECISAPRALGTILHCSPCQISCGGYHSAMVTSRGELYTWGYGRAGRLGSGSEEDQLHPLRVPAPSERCPLVDASAMKQFQRVSCGASFTVASIGATGFETVWACGQGWEGQLGAGGAGVISLTLRMVPRLSLSQRVRHIATREGVVLLMEDASTLAWGKTPQFLDGVRFSPTPVAALSRAQQVALGQDFALVLTRDGGLEWWQAAEGVGIGGAPFKRIPVV